MWVGGFDVRVILGSVGGIGECDWYWCVGGIGGCDWC